MELCIYPFVLRSGFCWQSARCLRFHSPTDRLMPSAMALRSSAGTTTVIFAPLVLDCYGYLLFRGANPTAFELLAPACLPILATTSSLLSPSHCAFAELFLLPTSGWRRGRLFRAPYLSAPFLQQISSDTSELLPLCSLSALSCLKRDVQTRFLGLRSRLLLPCWRSDETREQPSIRQLSSYLITCQFSPLSRFRPAHDWKWILDWRYWLFGV